MSLTVRILRLCIALPAFLVMTAVMGTIILLVGLPLATLEMLFTPRPKAPEEIPPAEERPHVPREFRPWKDMSVRDRLALRVHRGDTRG